MAETNEKKVLDGENKAEENKTPTKDQTAPPVVEFTDTGGGGTPGEKPGQKEAETPPTEQTQDVTGQEKNKTVPPLNVPAPDVADGGDVVISSKDINGVFEEKRAAAKDAERQAAEMDAGKDAPDKKNQGRQPKTKTPEKSTQTEKGKNDKPPTAPKGKQAASVGGGGIGGANGKTEQTPVKTETPPASAQSAPTVPEPPRDATRPGEKETIVYIDHSELHPFKNHPFKVKNDDAMKALVESVKERGFDQAAIVRPREEGGYELVAGHRRQAAAEMAGYSNLPCVVRNLTDEEAVLAMTESNFTYRSEILASERAQALKMQLDAIKRQGERFTGVASGDVGKRSNEIIAEKNQMSAKTVQRYIALNNLVPELMQLTDDKKIPFMTAFEMSYIKPKLQQYIATNIEAQEAAPTLAQAHRMRELDEKHLLKADTIDGIMLEEKKEDRKVIISGQELEKYFGLEKSPKEMKDTILKLLDEYKAKNPLELDKPDKKKDAPEK